MNKLESEWGTPLDLINTKDETLVCQICWDKYAPNRSLCPSEPDWHCCYMELPDCDHPKKPFSEIE